jgi:putative tricarboxylic transport membrane protein
MKGTVRSWFAGGPNFNTWAGVLCVAFALFLFLIMPDQIEEPPKLFGRSTSALSPKLFPSIVAGLLLVVGGWLAIASFRLREQNDLRRLARGALTNITVTVGLLLTYALLLEPLGFILSSVLVSVALAFYYGGRNPLALALVTIGVPVAIFVVFSRLLHVFLPEWPGS